jgi:hypothetical protein
MAVDQLLLEQVLTMPETLDVTRSPIVTAIILNDPTSAADLVLALEPIGSKRSRNARSILCHFGAEAVPFLLGTVGTATPESNKEIIEIMWAMFAGENRRRIRNTLAQVSDELDVLLDDKRLLPDDPETFERDFSGRICDLAYTVLSYLDDPDFDRSLFRSMGNDERDVEIRRYRSRIRSLS